MKICSKCYKEKPLQEFYFKRNKSIARCKECTIRYSKQYQVLNRERDRQKKIDHRKATSKENIIRACEWNKNNPVRRKEIANTFAKKYRTERREEYLQYTRKWGKKRLKNPAYRLSSRMRASIWECLKGIKNRQKWQILVSYSLRDLQLHLEKQFLPGMTWENYGQWHIDHKIPLAVFNFTSPNHPDFKKCWGLKNLQPLWAEDNLKKHSKLDQPFQPSLAITT